MSIRVSGLPRAPSMPKIRAFFAGSVALRMRTPVGSLSISPAASGLVPMLVSSVSPKVNRRSLGGFGWGLNMRVPPGEPITRPPATGSSPMYGLVGAPPKKSFAEGAVEPVGAMRRAPSGLLSTRPPSAGSVPMLVPPSEPKKTLSPLASDSQVCGGGLLQMLGGGHIASIRHGNPMPEQPP